MSALGRAERVFVGLGSNLGRPVEQVRLALSALDALPGTRCVARSALYHSLPMGPADQPDFVNAVAALETRLDPRAVLDHLLELEIGHGRVRGGLRWGPRTLDLDLLLYGEQVFDSPGLTVPHPGLHERAFVLYPLHEIAPELVIPRYGTIAQLLNVVPVGGLRVIAPR